MCNQLVNQSSLLVGTVAIVPVGAFPFCVLVQSSKPSCTVMPGVWPVSCTGVRVLSVGFGLPLTSLPSEKASVGSDPTSIKRPYPFWFWAVSLRGTHQHAYRQNREL